MFVFVGGKYVSKGLIEHQKNKGTRQETTSLLFCAALSIIDASNVASATFAIIVDQCQHVEQLHDKCLLQVYMQSLFFFLSVLSQRREHSRK